MSPEVVWLLVSFAIMVVAILATYHEKMERLEERLRRLENAHGLDEDERRVDDDRLAVAVAEDRRRDRG
jgi:hypothetical protein